MMIRLIPVAAVAALFFVQAAAQGNSPSSAASNAAAVEVQMSMRKLWEEHTTYTRNYIISALAGLPDSDAVAKRLLRNQDDIGNAI